MSLVNSKKVAENRYELEIAVDGEKFRKAIQDVYNKERKNINVPGFRKGKAPLHIIEKYYGESVFFEDALNSLYGPELEAAAAEAGLEIVNDKMDFDLVSISKENGADFKVTITTVPEVEIGEYKGLKVEKSAVKVDKKEVDEALKSMADRNARVVAVEGRPAQKDDIAVIDFEGFVDGKAFEGGKGESYSLTLGSGQFIPGFEDQIIGHNTDDEFDVNVEFPKEYQAEELAGKPAVFKVKIHEIKCRELPEIDDEFAKDVSEFDTLDELKKDIKEKALERKKKAAEEEVENKLIDMIVETVKGEIPEAMFENRVKQSLEDFDYRLQMQGMNLDTYLQYTGSTREEFAKTFRPQAEKQVKIRLALEKIVKLENLTATEAEVEDYYKKMSEDYSVPAEQIKASVPASEIIKDLAVNKAIDFVKDSAVISEPVKKTAEKTTDAAKGETKKTTPKKPAAKKSAPTKKTAEKKIEE